VKFLPAEKLVELVRGQLRERWRYGTIMGIDVEYRGTKTNFSNIFQDYECTDEKK
jgi:hypothetical protein